MLLKTDQIEQLTGWKIACIQLGLGLEVMLEGENEGADAVVTEVYAVVTEVYLNDGQNGAESMAPWLFDKLLNGGGAKAAPKRKGKSDD